MKPFTVANKEDAKFFLNDLKNYIDAGDFSYFDPKKWESDEEHSAIMDAYSRALGLLLSETTEE